LGLLVEALQVLLGAVGDVELPALICSSIWATFVLHKLGDTMNKTATARARVEPDVKEEAERILGDCGLSASQAIGLFYRQVILERGLPFRIKSFNEETRRVLRDSERGVEVEQFDSAEALFEDLRI
jgi:DNA-damage-inducible protein J